MTAATTPFEEMARLLGMLPAPARERMVGMYVESLARHISELDVAMVPLAQETAVDLAHKIAGSAAMMQDRNLSMSAREMEKCLRDGRADEALRLWPLVQLHADETLAYLRALG